MRHKLVRVHDRHYNATTGARVTTEPSAYMQPKRHTMYRIEHSVHPCKSGPGAFVVVRAYRGVDAHYGDRQMVMSYIGAERLQAYHLVTLAPLVEPP